MAKQFKEKEIQILPNPDAFREQCISHCKECEKMFSDENIGDVCMVYESPKAIWDRKNRDPEHYCHFNAPDADVKGKKKINPLKASKRGRR